MAYCLDEAVAMIGNHIMHMLDSVEGKNSRQVEAKRKALLQRLLENRSRFREPSPTK